MSIIIGIIIGLLILTLLVVIHEYGHYIAAKKSGVHVEEFAIGFPPSALKWQRKGKKWVKIPRKDWKNLDREKTIFSLNWIPVGGFCRMKGESDDDKRPNSFGKSSLWSKTKILFGGILLNFAFAALIFTVLAWTGMPMFLENQFQIESDSRTASVGNVFITRIEEGSPAATAGLQPGDEILSINGLDILDTYQITSITRAMPGETIHVVYQRDKQQSEVDVKLLIPNEERSWVFGVSSNQAERYYNTWSAPVVGVVTTVQLTGETFRGVGTMLWNFVSGVFRQVSFDQSVREDGREAIGAAGDGLSGPVGIVGMIFPAFVESGPTNLFFLSAVISISLACMNALPIPALDGGRWFLIVLFRIRKKTLSKEIEERIVSRAFIVLIGLIVLITILDITRFFR